MLSRLTLVVALLILVICVKAIAVSGHHQGEFFPNIPRSYYVLMNQMEEVGDWRWAYTQRCNSGNILADIKAAMDDTAIRYNTPHTQYAYGASSVQNHISTCGTDFTVHCGGGFAVACVGADAPGFPRNCDAYYDGPYMETFWSPLSRRSIPQHELQHCQTMRAEGYNDVDWNCNPVPPQTFVDTIMGCGPQHSLTYTPRDDWDWFIVHIPPKLHSYYGVFNDAGQQYVYYCGTDVNANRVYLYYERPQLNTGLVWSGERLAVAPGNACQKHPVFSGWCYWLKQTNAVADLNYAGEVKVGCS